MMLQEKPMRKHSLEQRRSPMHAKCFGIFLASLPFTSAGTLCHACDAAIVQLSKPEVFCNIGNPHAVGQKPITFYRQAKIGGWQLRRFSKVTEVKVQGLMKAVQRYEGFCLWKMAV